MKSLFRILSSISLLSSVANAQAKMKELSFDMAALGQYPQAWTSYGSAVPLKSKVKVTPPTITDVAGQIFLDNALETPAWEAEIKFMVNSFK